MAKLMIVEDSKDLLEIYSHLFNMKGFEVRTATSGESLVNQLSVEMPDVIIMDVRLKNEDGRKLCKDIKQKEFAKHIPIILISASMEMLADYKECKADAIIEKPFDIHTVTNKINLVLGKKNNNRSLL